MDDKQYKFLLRLYAAITLVWLVLLMLGCIAVFQVIVVHAAEPSVIKNGEYIICEIHTQDDAVEIQEGPPINDVSIALDEVDAEGHQLSYMGEFRISFYCSCRKCNGHWGAIDGYGENSPVFSHLRKKNEFRPVKGYAITRSRGSGISFGTEILIRIGAIGPGACIGNLI